VGSHYSEHVTLHKKVDDCRRILQGAGLPLPADLYHRRHGLAEAHARSVHEVASPAASKVELVIEKEDIPLVFHCLSLKEWPILMRLKGILQLADGRDGLFRLLAAAVFSLDSRSWLNRAAISTLPVVDTVDCAKSKQSRMSTPKGLSTAGVQWTLCNGTVPWDCSTTDRSRFSAVGVELFRRNEENGFVVF
jgi:hypothetical protein